MTELGAYALILAWVLSAAGMVAAARAGRREHPRAFLFARNAGRAGAVAGVVALIALGVSFLTDDFSNQYVWAYSSRDLDWVYKLSAIWGGQDGSLLLWAVTVGLINALFTWLLPSNFKIRAYSVAVLNSCFLFFLSIVLFFSNPFHYLDSPTLPPDGNGLNPLLQNIYMALHPPLLYVGFALCAVPFALACAVMFRRDYNGLASMARSWSLAAWIFLTIGIVLGAQWAYLELGWGGYWGWDPVENASLLPWLTATGLLHSLVVSSRRQMFSRWTLWLIILTYVLTVFGTFLTRSGVVQSVHAFASSSASSAFLGYVVAVLVLGFVLVRRIPAQPPARSKSGIGKEDVFLLTNLILLFLCLVILYGVMAPVFSDLFFGKKLAFDAHYYNAVTLPLFILLLVLLVLCPLLPWRGVASAGLARGLGLGALAGVGVGLFSLLRGAPFLASSAYGASAAVAVALLFEALRDLLRQRERWGAFLMSRRSRYGAYLSHFGALIMACSITASGVGKIEQEASLTPGESATIGNYRITLESFSSHNARSFEAAVARLAVTKEGSSKKTVLTPELRYYRQQQQTAAEVAVTMAAARDIYAVFAGIDESGRRGTFKLVLNPFQVWLWVGSALLVLGAGLAWLPLQVRAQEE